MTKFGGGWYTERTTKGPPPLRIPKLSKKGQERKMKFKYIYIKLIGIGMILYYNYICTRLNGSI